MHAHRKPDGVAGQHQPPGVAPARRLEQTGPFEHNPKRERGEKNRHGVDLRLHRRKPECVGDGKRERGNGRSHNGRERRRPYGPADKVVGDEIEQRHGCARADGANQVAAEGDLVGRGRKERKQPYEQQEKRRAGRVAHFEPDGTRNELAAVPKAGCGRERDDVEQCRKSENGCGYRPLLGLMLR